MRRLSFLILAATFVLPAFGAEVGRFPDLTPEQMTPEQKAIVAAIAASPRKSAAGPFKAWLRSPPLADRLQQVGQYVRFQSSLPPRLSEFVILLTGRYWNSQFEWAYHYPLAVEAGVSLKPLADLAGGEAPRDMNADEALVYAFVSELREAKTVSDPTYAKALARFGERGIVDLVAGIGYYDIVCMTLNVAEVPAPIDYRGLPLTMPASRTP